MRRATSSFFLAYILALAPSSALAQSASVSSNLPAFDAATIKPPDPGAKYQRAGFYGQPGGRIFFGGKLKMLVEYAFNLQGYQVAGGRTGWIRSGLGSTPFPPKVRFRAELE